MKFLLIVFLLLLAGIGFGERQPFERYQSILDRQMFGVPPPGFDPMKPPSEVQKLSRAEQKELTQEQEKLQSSVHFSVIRVSPEGQTQVGFTDNSDPKAPRNYFLKVGETQDGWTVKEADAAAETMTIVKDDIEISLKIGDNSGKGGGKTSKAGAASDAAAGRPAGSRGGLLGRANLGRMSLRERRAQRQQQEQAAKAEADAKAAEKEAARQEQAAREKAEREEERQQQRQQLLAIQEELRKAREARQNAEKSAEGGDNGGEAQ